MPSPTSFLPAVVASLSLLPLLAAGFTLSPSPVSSLLKEHSAAISSLKTEAETIAPADAPSNDVFYLRYCLGPFETDEERTAKLVENLNWRAGDGKAICDAAKNSIAEATSSGGWDNTPVIEAAPHSSIVNKYITPSQCVTTTSRTGDLVYCIRAGQIDDVGLMSEVTLDQMTDFFVYCKEVNAEVADARSLETDRLMCLVTANDLSGVKLVGGDATFRKALSAASKKANDLYPSLNGPTLLLNLPRLLGALAKIFTPLFPEEVRKRLKFERGPLEKVDGLSDVLAGEEREKFLDALDELVYSD